MFNGKKKIILFDNQGVTLGMGKDHNFQELIKDLKQNGHDIGGATYHEELDDISKENLEDLGIDWKSSNYLLGADKQDHEYFTDYAVWALKYNIEDIVLVDDGDFYDTTCEENNPHVQAINQAGGTGIHFDRNRPHKSVLATRKKFEELGIL